MQHNLAVFELSFHAASAGCEEVAQRAGASGSLRTETLARVVASERW